eukprot:NODE_1188_length_1533_cov_18.449461_g985_i0.p1 GENE.NODE_1188_length_1533_cov_18.449461_g985_i0~~NODE_1188_length_1533_cov_18.449461_g985_i0.p1  ORF type:complete len:482 (+),score=195.87 NODE_1188_length_1533_cov_18.449461_g985_i0:129-1448(+)
MLQRVFRQRAEVRYLMKHQADALADLEQVLKLNPAHKSALTLRSKMAKATGDFEMAARDFSVLASITEGKKAQEHQQSAADMRKFAQRLAGLQAQYDARHTLEPHQRSVLAVEGVRQLEEIVGLTKDARPLHLLRARMAVEARDHSALTKEVNWLLTRDSTDLEAMYIRAQGFKAIGALDVAKQHLRACTEIDQDYKPCRDLMKQIKAYMKKVEEIEGFRGQNDHHKAIAAIHEARKVDPDGYNLGDLVKWECSAYVALRDLDKGLETCSKILDGQSSAPNLVDVYLDRAELYMLGDQLDKAGDDINKAKELEQNNRRVHQKQQQLDKLKKMKDRKDYYAILGVKKTADEKEIKRNYKKLAMEHHPDKIDFEGMSEDEKKKAVEKFQDINAAKEILLDDEKRRKYDLGEDVEAPQQNQQQGFGGFPFGGGGQQFHFRFG